MESVPYFLNSESGALSTSSNSPPIMTILKYPDVHIGSSLILKSGMSLTLPVPPITQVYTRRGKNHPVNTNSIQIMQDHETCSSPVEPDPITESPQSPTETPDPTHLIHRFLLQSHNLKSPILTFLLPSVKAYVNAPVPDIPSTTYVPTQPYPQITMPLLLVLTVTLFLRM